METEKIKFEFWFTSEYWNTPPKIDILIDDQTLGSYEVVDSQTYISFFHTLDFKKHTLKIKRYGKTDSESKQDNTGNWLTQSLVLTKLKIDDINIRSFLWHYSKFYPEYSKSYQNENSNLELEVVGELYFGHNGTWEYDFRSPFYKDVVSKVRNA